MNFFNLHQSRLKFFCWSFWIRSDWIPLGQFCEDYAEKFIISRLDKSHDAAFPPPFFFHNDYFSVTRIFFRARLSHWYSLDLTCSSHTNALLYMICAPSYVSYFAPIPPTPFLTPFVPLSTAAVALKLRRWVGNWLIDRPVLEIDIKNLLWRGDLLELEI